MYCNWYWETSPQTHLYRQGKTKFLPSDCQQAIVWCLNLIVARCHNLKGLKCWKEGPLWLHGFTFSFLEKQRLFGLKVFISKVQRRTICSTILLGIDCRLMKKQHHTAKTSPFVPRSQPLIWKTLPENQKEKSKYYSSISSPLWEKRFKTYWFPISPSSSSSLKFIVDP